MKNQANPAQALKAGERGNVLFWILLCIALFAALSFAVSQGSNVSDGLIDNEKTDLAVTEILSYAQTVKAAVHGLQIDGCEDTQISFENTEVSGYTNAGAPSDNSCDVFDFVGGGLPYTAPESDWQSAASAWIFTGANCVDDLGTGSTTCHTDTNAATESLIMVLPNLNEAICEQINTRLNISNPSNDPPVDSGFTTTKFTGTYADGAVIGDEGTGIGVLSGKSKACLKKSGDSTYHFYQVLIAR